MIRPFHRTAHDFALAFACGATEFVYDPRGERPHGEAM